MFMNRAGYLAFWAPRIGEEAARLQWSNAMYALTAWLVGIVWLAAFVVGGRFHLPLLIVLGAVLVPVSVAGLVMSFVRIRQANRAASRCLGVEIRFRRVPSPPKMPARYEEWCRKYSLVPYAANEPTPTEGRH